MRLIRYGPLRAAAAAPGVAAMLCILASPVVAQNDDYCEGPGTLEVRPAHGALSVVLDPIIRARYPDNEAALAEMWSRFDAGEALITLHEIVDDDEVISVPGTLQRGGDRMLFFTPRETLVPGAEYKLKVYAQDQGAVPSKTFKFETAFSKDKGPPTLDFDEQALTLVTGVPAAACGFPDGSVSVGIVMTAACDDGDPSSIEHFAYLTRARGLEAPRLVARVDASAAMFFDGQSTKPCDQGGSATVELDFVLSPEEAKEPVCVRIRVIDGRLNRAEEEPEICFDPIQGSFFRPLCTVATVGGRPGEADSQFLGAFLILSTVAWRLGRRPGQRGGSRRA